MIEGASQSDVMPGLPIERRVYEAGVQACIHCGLCLPACPTYAETGREADSPRGRIYLMKTLADGRFTPRDDIVEHLDLCLDCRACEPVCPSGVVYHELIEQTRAALEKARPQPIAPACEVEGGRGTTGELQIGSWARHRGLADRLGRWVLLRIMTRPARLKMALLMPKLLHRLRLWRPLARTTARRLPGMIGRMQRLTPVDTPLWPRATAGRHAPLSQRRMTVGFFAGCVGSVAHSEVDRKAIDLLRLGGAEVIVPRASGCCGAIPHHAAVPDEARAMAKRNIEAFAEARWVVTDIAGCGAMLKQYDELFHNDPGWAERARAFALKVRDIHEALVDLPLPEPTHRVPLVATYHEACHLVHGQGVSEAPRSLLARVPGLEHRDLDEATMCCGAAGSYNLEQPDMADRLGDRKARAIEATGATVCTTANIGCAMQIASTLRQRGTTIAVKHPVDLIHASHFGQRD